MITGFPLTLIALGCAAIVVAGVAVLVYVIPLLVIDEVTEALDRRRDRQLADARARRLAAAVPPPPGPAPDLRADHPLAA